MGWNPVPQVYGTNFADLGICHLSTDVEDLFTKFDYWLGHNKILENEKNYENFLRKYNYPFDGKATWRMIELLKDPTKAKISNKVHEG